MHKTHLYLLFSLTALLLVGHWFAESIFYLATPDKYGPWLVAGVFTGISGIAFYVAQKPFFNMVRQKLQRRRSDYYFWRGGSEIKNVLLVLALTFTLVWAAKGVGSVGCVVSGYDCHLKPFYLLGVVAFFVLSYYAGGSAAVRVVNMGEHPGTPKVRSDLVVFLSKITTNIPINSAGQSMYDLTEFAKQFHDSPSTPSEHFIQLFSTPDKNNNPPPFYNLVPLIKSIRHHYTGKSPDSIGSLQRLYVVCSADTVSCFPFVYDHLQAMFGAGQEGELSVHSILNASSGFEVGMIDPSWQPEEFAKHVAGIGSEDTNALHLALESVVRYIEINHAQPRNDVAAAEKMLMIDGTGGKKPASMVAAMMTIGRYIELQYVQTDGNKEVVSFDFYALPRAVG